MMRYINTLSYIILIILINVLFSVIPEITLWNNVVSPVDVLVGCVYVFRDLAQREIKHYVIVAMLVATSISYLLAEKQIALASVTAFFAGELIDWALYTLTQKPLSQRILWSSIISSPIDSIIFLYMTNSLNILGFGVLVIAKVIGVLGIWYYWRIRHIREMSLAEEALHFKQP